MHRPSRWVGLAILAIAASAGASVWFGYGEALERAHERIGSGSQIAQTRCGPIEYAIVGDGESLLFVHGAGGGFDQGLDIAAEMAKQGLRVITMSRFGYLRTPLPAEASAAAQADAHACLLDALGIETAVVAGVSAGAPSSIQFALRHPQRTKGLILLVPAYTASERPTSPPPATQWLFDTALRSDFLFWLGIRIAPDALIESVLATPPSIVRAADAAERARVARVLEQILPVSARRRGLLNDARVLSTTSGDALERISAPALVISVKDDGFGTWTNAKIITARLPHARFVGYDSGGHVWVGHHREMLAEATTFARAVSR